MGRPAATGNELAPTVQTDSFTATGVGTKLVAMLGRFNWSVYGTFVGTAILSKSYDGGVTLIPCKDINSNAASATAVTTFVIEEVEPGVLYQSSVTAYTSGTINTRISGNAPIAGNAVLIG